MKKPIAVLLVFAMVAALAAPAVALAQGGRDARKTERSAAKSERTAQHEAEKAARRAEHRAEKAARRAEHRAEKAAREASRSADADEYADEATRSVEPTGSVEGTRPVGPGVRHAFSRITANLEKSLAKMADGKKKQLPPGLVRVWLKFAAWLGVDKSTMPGLPGPVPTSTVEPTGTLLPTSAGEPTVTPSP